MSPPEFLFALAFLVFLPAFIFKSVLKYKREQRMLEEGAEPSLSTSELEALVRLAVEDAVRPLEDQIAELEDRLVGRLDGTLLEDEADAFAEESEARAPVRTVGRRRRAR